MVNQKQTKRKRDIKTKLMAAICMLLVSSIMMVSTTYAWFTLSTAPEVTGINTAVGANGNLEMALMPADGLTQGSTNNFGITSEAGDSTKAANERNVTWGNLVDVSSNEFYGLNNITLYPAKLNVVEDGSANGALAAAMLMTPAYGADGRVSELKADTVTSTYDSTEENFPQNDEYGIRAVGTASGMTDRQLAYRNARSAANTAMAMAKTVASQSLNTNGASLANIAVSHAANQGNETYTAEDIDKLEAIVNDLLGTADSTGVLEYIEEAYLNYIIAFGASQAAATAGMDDTEFGVFKNTITNAADVYAAVNACATAGLTLPGTITGPVASLQTTKTSVTNARDGLAGITAADGITWDQFDDYLYMLADMDAMKINGYAASTFRENMSNIINGIASGGLTVSIASGGGVYADVADHCGNFTASIVIEEVTYNGMTLSNMTARMATETTVSPVYLAVVESAVVAAQAPSGVGGQTMPISDFYGYVIDLAFRTNAAESNLLLQTEAVDRIYNSNGADAETMGHGSTMTFTSTTTDFTVDQLKSLIGAIRVVFFDPMDSNKILGIAKLDVANATVTGGNTVTAGLYLFETVAASTNYVAATAEQIAAAQAGSITVYTATTADSVTTYTPVAQADVQTDGSYFVQETTEATERKLTGTDAVITALTQNTATAVSALVYLDGENVGNDDVAATAATSMTGTMNLQFASSANLVPMEYTPLIVAGTSTGTTEATTETPAG